MKDELQKEENIVKTYKIGNTTVKICDDACKNKTDEEVEIILEKAKSIGFQAVKGSR